MSIKTNINNTFVNYYKHYLFDTRKTEYIFRDVFLQEYIEKDITTKLIISNKTEMSL